MWVCVCMCPATCTCAYTRASCFSAFGHWMVPVLLSAYWEWCKVELVDRYRLCHATQCAGVWWVKIHSILKVAGNMLRFFPKFFNAFSSFVVKTWSAIFLSIWFFFFPTQIWLTNLKVSKSDKKPLFYQILFFILESWCYSSNAWSRK